MLVAGALLVQIGRVDGIKLPSAKKHSERIHILRIERGHGVKVVKLPLRHALRSMDRDRSIGIDRPGVQRLIVQPAPADIHAEFENWWHSRSGRMCGIRSGFRSLLALARCKHYRR